MITNSTITLGRNTLYEKWDEVPGNVLSHLETDKHFKKLFVYILVQLSIKYEKKRAGSNKVGPTTNLINYRTVN